MRLDRQGRNAPAVEEEEEPLDRLAVVSTVSLTVLAVLATGAALFLMREVLLPIVTAFVVGVMVSPVAKALEKMKAPRAVAATLIVLVTALLIGFVAALIASPIAELANRLPAIGTKLHAFDEAFAFWRASAGVAGNSRPAALRPSFRCRASPGSRRRSITSRRRLPGSYIFLWCCFCS